MSFKIIAPLFIVILTSLVPVRKKITVFTAGDSTMADYSQHYLEKKYGSADYPLRGWMMAMPEHFTKHVSVKNYAVSGRSSKSFRAEGHWSKIMKEIQPGDYVFIQFGHNDQKKTDTARYAEANSEFKENMRNYVIETKEHGGRPVLFTSIVVRTFDSAGVVIDRHGDYVKVVRALAAETNTPLVDLNASTTELISSLGPAASKKLFMHIQPGIFPGMKDGLKDNVHLNIEGAKQVADLAAREIRKLKVRPLSGYLKK